MRRAVELVKTYFWPHTRAALRLAGLSERHATAPRAPLDQGEQAGRGVAARHSSRCACPDHRCDHNQAAVGRTRQGRMGSGEAPQQAHLGRPSRPPLGNKPNPVWSCTNCGNCGNSRRQHLASHAQHFRNSCNFRKALRLWGKWNPQGPITPFHGSHLCAFASSRAMSRSRWLPAGSVRRAPSWRRRCRTWSRGDFHKPTRRPAISISPQSIAGAMLVTRTCSVEMPSCRPATRETLCTIALLG
jgi:hypothetical protein